jgi:NADH:ubiquinone oxidoreductase subunit 2 (subunit N)
MNAPIIWIIIPGLASIVLFILQDRVKFVNSVGILLALLLGLFAIALPIGQTITLGALSFEISDTLVVLGRRFVISKGDTALIALMYFGAAFWFGGVIFAKTARSFIPLALGISATLIAAFSVVPFLYGPLLFELAVLVSIPLLAQPGTGVSKGVLRYLTYQTLGFPFLLFSGWMLAGIEVSPGNSLQILQASVLLALGFAFLLGVFPFHTWIPMLGESAHPYNIAFVYYQLPIAITIFALNLFDQYVWLRSSATTHSILIIVGITMIFVGGAITAFQRHLGRMMGYALIVDIGFSLIAISSGLVNNESLGLFFGMLLPRGLTLGVWSLALVVISSKVVDGNGILTTVPSSLSFRGIQGIAHRLPVASFCLLIAYFSIAGFPLMAGFSVRHAILDAFQGRNILSLSLILLGMIGVFIGGARTIAVMISGTTDGGWQRNETAWEVVFLSLGSVSLLILGLFPKWFIPVMFYVIESFDHIGP